MYSEIPGVLLEMHDAIRSWATVVGSFVLELFLPYSTSQGLDRGGGGGVWDPLAVGP